MHDIADEQLVVQAQAGDRAALGDLLTRYQETVFMMAMRILHHREEALDATQEAMLRVVKYLGTFQPGRPFRPWVRTVAVRSAMDQARRASPQTAAGRELDSLAAPGPDPLQAVCSAELIQKVHQTLASLSPAQRAAFVCKEVEGMDTRQTARAMGCSRATVRWHLFEARKKLAALLDQPGRGES